MSRAQATLWDDQRTTRPDAIDLTAQSLPQPNGWNSDELFGDVPLDMVYRDGLVQPLLVR